TAAVHVGSHRPVAVQRFCRLSSVLGCASQETEASGPAAKVKHTKSMIDQTVSHYCVIERIRGHVRVNRVSSSNPCGFECSREFSLFEPHKSGTIPTEPLALPTNVLAAVIVGVRRGRRFYGEDFAFR